MLITGRSVERARRNWEVEVKNVVTEILVWQTQTSHSIN